MLLVVVLLAAGLSYTRFRDRNRLYAVLRSSFNFWRLPRWPSSGQAVTPGICYLSSPTLYSELKNCIGNSISRCPSHRCAMPPDGGGTRHSASYWAACFSRFTFFTQLVRVEVIKLAAGSSFRWSTVGVLGIPAFIFCHPIGRPVAVRLPIISSRIPHAPWGLVPPSSFRCVVWYHTYNMSGSSK